MLYVVGASKLFSVSVLALALLGGGWTAHAPLPVARTEVASTAFGREIVVAGGYLADGGSSRKVDFYKPSSNTWRSGPDLPAGVNHASATVARGSLYVLGGYGAERSAFVFDGQRLANAVDAVAACRRRSGGASGNRLHRRRSGRRRQRALDARVRHA